MKYDIYLTTVAQSDASFFERSGLKSVQSKIVSLLNDIAAHPYTGIGKPEILRGNLSGCMSRRINKEPRIIYSVDDERRDVTVLSLKGHY